MKGQAVCLWWPWSTVTHLSSAQGMFLHWWGGGLPISPSLNAWSISSAELMFRDEPDRTLVRPGLSMRCSVPLALRLSGAHLLGPHLADCTVFPSVTPGTEQNVLSLPPFPTASPGLSIWTHRSLISVCPMSISSCPQPASHPVQNKPWGCQVCSTHVEKTKLVVILLFFRLFKTYF